MITRLSPSLVVLFALFLGVTPASAQEPSASSTVAEPAAPDAAQAEAMERFADAQALFERGDHAGALTEMQRVFELLEGSPRQYVVLFDLGRVHEELFEYDRAIELYERYLREAPADGEDRAEAEASLRTLERLLGTLAVRTNAPEAHLWLGDTDLGLASAEHRVGAGHHVIELRAEGFEPVRREIDLVARGRLELELPMAALSDFRGVPPWVFGTTTGLAGAALVAGLGLGGWALSLSADAGSCPDRMGCAIDVEGTRATVRDAALAADVLYGTAALFAVASVVLVFVTDWGGERGPRASVGVRGVRASRF